MTFHFSNIETFSNAGADINEDSYSVSARHLLVLDGAAGLYGKHVTSELSDACWLAKRGAEIYGRLLDAREDPMPELCLEASEIIRDEFLPMLPPDAGTDAFPSAALAALRLAGGQLEYYTLGDCTILLRCHDGQVECIHDNAVTTLDENVLHEMTRLAVERGEHVSQQRPRVQGMLRRNRSLRNQPEGYWIFDPTTVGATRGLCGCYPAEEIRTVTIMSDGFTDTVPLYELAASYDALLTRLETDGAANVCRVLRTVQKNDPGFDRFPRFKMGDDATIVMARVCDEKQQQ